MTPHWEQKNFNSSNLSPLFTLQSVTTYYSTSAITIGGNKPLSDKNVKAPIDQN